MFKFGRSSFKEKSGMNKVSKTRSFKKDETRRYLREKLAAQTLTPDTSPSVGGGSPVLNSAIITIAVGNHQRLFAAHEEVLVRSPWFAKALKDQFFDSQKRVTLPDEDPVVFSCVLEYLYKGDYAPRLIQDRKRKTYSLDNAGGDVTLTPRSGTTAKTFVGFNDLAVVYHQSVGDYILRDTAVWCAAQRFSLPDLQRLALQKQGLQTGVEIGTVLRSMRFAYANTQDGERKLRSHYLALIIRCRKTFRRSGTMQMEMEKGGTAAFFDLFAAMCNYLDDLEEKLAKVQSPPTNKF